MRRILAMSAAMALLLGLFPGVAIAADPDPNVVPNSWIVTLVDRADPVAEAPGLARRHGGQVGHVYEHTLSGFNFQGDDRAARALERNPRVRTVVADRYVHATAESLPTGIRRIRARHGDATVDTAHGADHHGNGARIAILDTGIDPNHEDLVANLDWSLGTNCIDATKEPVDGHGHGTHVAGTAAAVGDNTLGVVGVADQARLVPVKVLADDGSGSWASVTCGVDHVVGLSTDNDATNDVDVINMSLGGPAEGGHACNDGGLREAVCVAVAAGVVTVVAAGNDSDDASMYTPAGYPEAVTVSALADSDGEPGGNGRCWGFGPFCSQLDDTFANFSNYGSIVDVIAPGYGIYSTDKGNSYSTKSGTSMAAPHVAGVAALIRAADQTLSPAHVLSRMQETGECPTGEVNTGGATCDGQGQWSGDPDNIAEPLVNAYRAAASGPSEPEPGPDPVTDIAVTSVTATPTSAVQGGSVSVAVTVENVGNQDVDDNITVTLTDDTAGADIGSQTLAGGLTAGAWTTLTFTWTTDTTTTTGNHTLTASHNVTDDHVDNNSAFTTVEVIEEALTMHVAHLAGTSVNSGSSWTAQVTVTIQDAGGAPVEGTTVSFDYASGRGVTGTRSCTTGTNGTCPVEVSGFAKRDSSVKFTVTDVSHTSLTYDNTSNVTSSITVTKP